MDIKMKMPDLATNDGVEIGIAKWLVEVGQRVQRGQVIVEVETDKAVQEVESIASGVLTSIHVAVGEKVPVGQVIATIRTA